MSEAEEKIAESKSRIADLEKQVAELKKNQNQGAEEVRPLLKLMGEPVPGEDYDDTKPGPIPKRVKKRK